MSDYISREAAIEKITALINKSGKYTAYESGADDACFILEHEIPAADVVEVVRCKDCKSAQHDDLFGSLWCDGYHVDADFYCANGKRRADNG